MLRNINYVEFEVLTAVDNDEYSSLPSEVLRNWPCPVVNFGTS
jgi:hypothetical protein